MEIIVCALDCEIKPIKEYFGNKVKIYNCGVKAKNLNFISELNPNDHLINIGICGGKQIGEIFLCNKIVGNKTYYPDNLFTSGLKEKELHTLDTLADIDTINKNHDVIFDQEAATIFQAAQKYIGPHQISFIKIVSDNGTNTKNLSKNDISNLIENHISEIENFIKENKRSASNVNVDVSKYSEKLKASVSMENKLKQLIRYAKICDVDIDEYFKGAQKIKSKQDAIKFLNDFERFLILK